MFKLSYKRINYNYFRLIVILMLLGYVPVHAQEETSGNNSRPSGMVIDGYGNPLAGAEITVKNSQVKVMTAEDGTFDLNLGKGDIIQISHPYYKVKEVKIKKEPIPEKGLSVRLSPKAIKNPPVMDIAYDTINRKRYLGSASTIYTDQLTKSLSGNIISSFAGQLSGLFVEQTHGMRQNQTAAVTEVDFFVGNRPDFSIGSYSDNSQYKLNARGYAPVVLVDGVQRELFSVDPESIESVSIQKDALSSIGLGMRSSRGVLVITTKKPVKSGFQLSFTGQYGVQKPIKTPNPLSSSQYAYLLNEALLNDGKSAVYSSNDFRLFSDGSSPYTHPNVNWYDETMKNQSAIQSYSLSATGGNEVAQYYVNLNYLDEDGLFRTSSANNYNTNQNYKRYMITSNVNVNVTKDLKLGVYIFGRIEDSNQPGATTAELLDGIYKTPNNATAVFNPNGTYAGNVSFPNNLVSQAYNSGYMLDNVRDGLANIKLDYNFDWLLKGLSARVQGSVATQSRSAVVRKKQAMTYQYIAGENGEETYVGYGEIKSQTNEYNAVGNYQQMFGQFALDYKTLLGKNALGLSFVTDIQDELINYMLPSRPLNLSGRASFNHDMKYFAEAAVTRSHYNGYAPGRRWGTFYAFGLGWDVSREEFLSGADWLDMFKLRGVYGKTGNGVDNSGYYTWRTTYSYDGYFGYPQGSERGEPGANVIETDLTLTNNITWEKAHKVTVGTDIALFNNKLLFTADYYRDKYYDLLQQRGKSIELIGLKYPDENIGKSLRKGIELSITYQNNVGDFNYFITANWSCHTSEVLFMDEQYVQEEYGKRTGQPIGAWFGLVADGFYNSVEEIENSAVIAGETIIPGDIRYIDLNNDGVIDQYDMAPIGNNKALSYFGLNLGFDYKGFDFSVLLQGAYNRDIYLGDAGTEFTVGFQTTGQTYGQAYDHLIDRWTPETAATAKFPRLSAGSSMFGISYNTNPNVVENGSMTSFWVRSGNYIRVKNISIGYTLPDSFSKTYLGGSRVKIFVSGQNLFTQSACDLVDPEVINFRNYPILKSFYTGINIKF
ncbi:MAG: SusC/RagA family TonB-linked outer membrane protein [Candidatus Azobacteroides sp.]|nr:SusC/RagA family TonB-linked outer membrane protein [Candidatus Azobacteroides sp.]